jgi:rhodanese-related sulfurtransferase
MQELAEFTANNPWLVSGLFASLLAVIFNELRLKSRGVSAVSTVMAVRLINDGGAVVDVREADVYADSHIIDAHNIGEKQLADNTSALDRFKKTIILVCDNGGRSGQCATKLRTKGNERVFSLKGGLQAWQQENLPVNSRRKN